MTSVGVISSAVKRIEQVQPAVPAKVDEVLEHLEKIKELLETAYQRREEKSVELEIKEAVRLSYEIVDVIADSFKSGTVPKKLKELLEKLKGGQDQLTKKLEQKQEGTRKGESRVDQKQEGTNQAAEAVWGQKQKQEGTNKTESTVSQKQEGTNTTESTAAAVSSQTQEGTNTAESTTTVVSPQKQEEESLLDRLKKDLESSKDSEPLDDQHRVVYIAGKSGMGKSTLARKLYNDPNIRKGFNVFGWVTVGRNFVIKRVLRLLLQQLGGGQHEQQQDLREKNEAALIVDIFFAVHRKSYLLVLEDVGSPSDWESISIALPLEESTRIIITTSSTEFSSSPHHYKVTGLTLVETLAFLNKEASTLGPEIGEAIYKISDGSPLFTTILVKSLEQEADDPHLVTKLASYESDKIRGTPEVIDLCYRRLVYELKPCFLYLGLFPPGQHLQVDKLYLLLLSENLTPSLERISFRKKLDELADLKLVEVEEDIRESGTRSGLYDSCRLHGLVQDFCISKGSAEEFFQIVDFRSFEPKVGPHTYRLAIYMRNCKDSSSISFEHDEEDVSSAKKILSLLVFDGFEGKNGWPPGIGDLTEFVHLRVLNFDEVDFKARLLPKGLEKLRLLRFLSFRGCFLEKLPSSLGSLEQVEALDLLVREDCSVIIPHNIFDNMKKMVHLYLPRRYKKSEGKEEKKLRLQFMKKLETLVNFDTEAFDVGDLFHLTNLKILSTISNGGSPEDMEVVINLLNEQKEKLQYSSMEVRSFDCYNRASTSALKKLMQCRFVHSLRIEGEIGELPAEEDETKCSDRSVAEMVLHGSELEGDPMPYFGKFENLLSLVLEDDAFMGTEILISPSPLFGKLRSLKLLNLQYLEKLKIEEGALPQLSSLKIENCGDELDLTIPKELYDRLKNEIGGDAYSVAPAPSKFKTTP